MATYYPEVYQYHFDWGASVGTESGYTLGTLDTDDTVNVSSGNVNKYLRFVLNQRNTKTLTNPTRTYKLICRRNSSDWGTAFDVTASSSYVRMYNHASLTHGDDCTDRLGVPTDSYWLSNNNGVCDTSGTMGASLTWPDSSRYRSEHLWSLEFIKDDLANNDVLDFRVVESDGTVLYSYTVADATITVTKVVAETGDCTDGIKWGDDPSALKVISVDGTDGIKWGDDLSPVLIASSLTDGFKIGENIDTVTYESFGGDGWKVGDSPEVAVEYPASSTDGIKWGDDSDAILVIYESATDGIKWGDTAEAITEAVGSLTDGIKWGDWGTEILGFKISTYPASAYVLTGVSFRDVTSYGGKIFSVGFYISTGAGNDVRVAVYDNQGEWPNSPSADLVKDYGVITVSAGWNVVFDEDLSVVSAGHALYPSFKTNDGTTNIPLTSRSEYSKTKFSYVSGESTDETDPWDDPYAGLDSGGFGEYSVYVEVLTSGPVAVVQTSASISDGIKWGDDAVGVESGAETGDCTDGIFWGDSISVEAASVVSATDGWKLGDSSSVTIVAPKSATDGILWGDQAVGSTEDNQVEVTDGILWGENIDTVTYEQFSGDGIKWGDSVSSFIGQWAVLVDGWVWGENFDLVTVTYFPDDGIVWGDSVFVGTGAAVDLTDGWKLGDVAAPFIGIFDSVEDGIKWGDSPEEDVISWNYCQDGIKWGEAVSSIRTRPASAADKILWGDQIFAETQTGGGDTYYGNPSDGIKWGDSVSPLQQRVDSISDGWKMGDLISLNQSLGRTLIDGIRWGEAVAGSKADIYIDSLSDGWIWGDDTYYAELGALLSMDAYIVSMLGMMSDIEHRRLIGDVEVEHMLSMKPRIQK